MNEARLLKINLRISMPINTQAAGFLDGFYKNMKYSSAILIERCDTQTKVLYQSNCH